MGQFDPTYVVICFIIYLGISFILLSHDYHRQTDKLTLLLMSFVTTINFHFKLWDADSNRRRHLQGGYILFVVGKSIKATVSTTSHKSQVTSHKSQATSHKCRCLSSFYIFRVKFVNRLSNKTKQKIIGFRTRCGVWNVEMLTE